MNDPETTAVPTSLWKDLAFGFGLLLIIGAWKYGIEGLIGE